MVFRFECLVRLLRRRVGGGVGVVNACVMFWWGLGVGGVWLVGVYNGFCMVNGFWGVVVVERDRGSWMGRLWKRLSAL